VNDVRKMVIIYNGIYVYNTVHSSRQR